MSPPSTTRPPTPSRFGGSSGPVISAKSSPASRNHCPSRPTGSLAEFCTTSTRGPLTPPTLVVVQPDHVTVAAPGRNSTHMIQTALLIMCRGLRYSATDGTRSLGRWVRLLQNGQVPAQLEGADLGAVI